MSVSNFMTIHPIIIEIFQSGLKWWSNIYSIEYMCIYCICRASGQSGSTKPGKLGQIQAGQSGKERAEMGQYIYCKTNEGNGEQVSRWAGTVRSWE